MTDCPCRAPLLTFFALTAIIAVLLFIIAYLLITPPPPILAPRAL